MVTTQSTGTYDTDSQVFASATQFGPRARRGGQDEP